MFSRPKKLYKYLSAEGAEKMLSSSEPTLWFRLPNRLNDIYDVRPIGSYADEFGAIAVFCLSETATSSPMWAHYGSNGEGIVLEFSMESEFFRRFPPLKVRYQKTRPSVKSRAEKGVITKNIEWKYEQEWRCLTTPFDAGLHGQKFLPVEQVISVPFPFDAVTALIHGHDSRVDAQNFLKKPAASHIKELVCRVNAWDYGFNVCAVSDCEHIFENQEAVIWGRRNRRK